VGDEGARTGEVYVRLTQGRRIVAVTDNEMGQPWMLAWVGFLGIAFALFDQLSMGHDRRIGMIVGAAFMIASLIWHYRRKRRPAASTKA
jgi:hypothetical protein